MKRRGRWLQLVAMWLASAVCVTTAAMYVVSHWWHLYYEGRRYSVTFIVNHLTIQRYPANQPFPYGWRAFHDYGLARAVAWPGMEKTQWSSNVTIPYWCIYWPAALVAWLAWVRGFQTRSGRCADCGYDLTGNVSGVCPECGASASTTHAPGSFGA